MRVRNIMIAAAGAMTVAGCAYDDYGYGDRYYGDRYYDNDGYYRDHHYRDRSGYYRDRDDYWNGYGRDYYQR